MNLNSLLFLFFILISVLGYYLLPGRLQWGWLLAVSYVYYAAGGPAMCGYILFTTITTFLCGRMIQGEEEEQKQKVFMLLGLVLNFGLLGVLKYSNFVIDNLNHLLHGNIGFLSLAVPLGISFYIFQSMGYLLDVYWGRIEAETNVLRFALFVSFFPQIMQGPIGRYSRLAHQLYEPHSFDPANLEEGLFRILWGFFKKLVLADTAGIFVTALFDHYEQYPGTAIFAVLAYAVQLYGDFSGGIDIVVGIGRLFGIEMDENFRQPYFAVTVTDFWHRWHITLGTWMKDYVFYPLALAGWMNRIGKWAGKKLGKKRGRTIPMCIANVIVFLIVGIWHGAEWRFILYGLYFGLIIACSTFFRDTFTAWKKALHINDKAFAWRVVQMLRTFGIVSFSLYLDRCTSMPHAFAMMRDSITEFAPMSILSVPIGNGGSTAYTKLALVILLFGILVQFVYSVLEERGICVIRTCMQQKLAVRILLLVGLFLAPAVLGQLPSYSGGFIYAQF